MAIISDIDRFIKTATQSAVYGTFSQRFDPKEFERDREDGVTILDLNPDCRVFIGGAEVTSDIDGVNISSSMDGSRCTLNLNNPRGKYEISKMDLMKRWREDKDILAAYTYKELQKSDPLNYDKLAQKLGDSVLGTQGGALVGQAVDIAKQLVDTFGGLAQGIPQSRGVTRMLFETKFYSGIARKAGDIVFDYRDPVFVFMKGRFSPFWYFAFTGIVISYSDTDAYGESNVLTINCEDTATLWKRTKMSLKGSFFGMSNLESRISNTNTKTAASPFGDARTNITFSNMIKLVAFTYDYGYFTKNCFPERVFDLTESIGGNASMNSQEALDYLRKSFGMGSTFKLTDSGIVNSVLNRISKQPSGVRSMNTIEYAINGNSFKGGPNEKEFSAANSIYFQLNQIEYPIGFFDGANISKSFDLSVRLWECQHDVDSKKVKSDKYNGTGWLDTKYFGICGNHPAMKYNFIDNFNMLPRIWSLYYRYGAESINKLKLTLYDKIYETVVGSPTEVVVSGTKVSSIPSGDNLNFFRPRLFVLLPQKYAGTRKLAGGFGELGKLDSETSTNIWDYLKAGLKNIEYNFYCSPCGDVYIEPELYDMHPIEFSNQIEPRSIIQKTASIEFSNKASLKNIRDTDMATSLEEGASPEGGETIPVRVSSTAYFFNPKANHPFFIMEKDRLRNTHEFSADKILSMVEVKGGMTATGGVAETIMGDSRASGFNSLITSMAEGNATKVTDSSIFVDGRYIADGFEAMTQDSGIQEEYQRNAKSYTETYEKFRQQVFVNLLSKIEYKVRDVIKEFLNGIIDLYNDIGTDNALEWNPSMLLTIVNFLKGKEDYIGQDGKLQKQVDFDSETYSRIVYDYCKDFLSSLKIQEEEPVFSIIDEQILKKSVKDFLYIATNPKQTLGTEAYVYNDFLKQKSGKSQKGEEGLYDTFKILSEYSKAGLFDLDGGSQNKNDVMGNKRNIIYTFINLREPYDLINDSASKSLYKQAQGFKKLIFLPREMRAVTLADLVEMRKKGVYDPRTDLIRTYGFKRGEAIVNQYVKNGLEAETYAKAVFNRILGEAHSINVTFIGRPEMWLNRPYFLERKDCIGLAKQYSISYKYGSDFTSTTLLTYIRKNTLTYAYAMDGLDTIVGDHDNNYFYKQGRLYLQLQQAIQKAGAAGTQVMGSLVSSSIGGSAGAITGEITSGLGNDALASINVGGLYVAPDVLGHMNYDSRGSSATVVADTGATATGNIYNPLYGEKLLLDTAQSIKIQLDLIKKGQSDIEDNIAIVKALDEDIKSLEKQITDEKNKKGQKDGIAIKRWSDELKSEEAAKKSASQTVENSNSSIQKAYAALYGPVFLKSNPGVAATNGGSDPTLTYLIKNAYRSNMKRDDAKYYGLFYFLFYSHVQKFEVRPGTSEFTKLNVTSKVSSTYKSSGKDSGVFYFITGF